MGTLGENLSSNVDTIVDFTKNFTANDTGVATAVGKAFTYAKNVGAWQWCFYIPAILALVTAFFVLVGLRDEPKEAGLPDLPDTGLGDLSKNKKSKKARKKFEMVMVWKNRWVWTFCIANLFVYVVRMGILDWGPKFLTEDRGLDIKDAAWTTAAFEIAGIVGTLFAGWATDHIFKGKGHRMCVVCMAGAALFMTLFLNLESASLTVTALLLMGAGFFIYGPQALIGIELGNQATKEASARANGIAGVLGYLGSGLSALLVGYVADAFGWSSVFKTIIIVAIIGMFILISMWKAPRDGYERAASIKYDEEELAD